MKDESLVIGFLEFLQTDKKIKTLTDTYELTEDGVFAATVEQSSGKSGWVVSLFLFYNYETDILTAILKWSLSNKTKKEWWISNMNNTKVLMEMPQRFLNIILSNWVFISFFKNVFDLLFSLLIKLDTNASLPVHT